MRFEYTGRHIDVTDALRSHVENHFDKIKNIVDGDGSNAHVIIEVVKNRNRSEVILNWRDQVLTATTTDADMYQSLTSTIDKIEKQALKLKKKVIDKHQKRAKKVTAVATPVDAVRVDTNTAPQIIDVELTALKPMTPEEAILRIDEDENHLVVFRNSENERVSVIFRRKDGNYGLIQP